MRTVLVAALLAATPAYAKKAPPLPNLEAQVQAWIAQVDALSLSMPIHPDLVVFTTDDVGGPLTLQGETGWNRLNGFLAEWKQAGGTITTTPGPITCAAGDTFGVCTTEYHQAFSQKGEPAGAINVRASFVFAAAKGSWLLRHVHESSPVGPIPPPKPPPKHAGMPADDAE